MTYDKSVKSYDKSAYHREGEASWWKKVKKPFLYVGTATALFIGSILGYNALQKSSEKQEAKEQSVVQKTAALPKEKLKKTVSELAQKESKTSRPSAQKQAHLPKTRTVVDYQFAIVSGKTSDEIHLDEGERKGLARIYQKADAAMDSWVASKIEMMRGNKVKAKQYENVAIRQFPELENCKTFQDVAFELYKKKQAAGIDTNPTRAKLAYGRLIKASRTKNPEARLKHLYKAITLTPEVGIMGPNLVLAKEIATAYKNGDHVIYRAQKVEVPVEKENPSAIVIAQKKGMEK